MVEDYIQDMPDSIFQSTLDQDKGQTCVSDRFHEEHIIEQQQDQGDLCRKWLLMQCITMDLSQSTKILEEFCQNQENPIEIVKLVDLEPNLRSFILLNNKFSPNLSEEILKHWRITDKINIPTSISMDNTKQYQWVIGKSKGPKIDKIKSNLREKIQITQGKIATSIVVKTDGMTRKTSENASNYLLIYMIVEEDLLEIVDHCSIEVLSHHIHKIQQEEGDGEFKWFLLKCRGGNEKKIIDYIQRHPLYQDNFKEEFIELLQHEKNSANRIKGINMFSGYFLCKMRDNSAARTVLKGARTSIIKEYTQDNIKDLVENIVEQGNLSTNKNFYIKEEVIVNTTIFNGEGIIISINDEKQTAIVQIFYFGSYNSISVPLSDLEKKRKK